MSALASVKRRLSTRWERSDRARQSRDQRAMDRDLPTWPRKEQATCCSSRRDELGRLPIGFCSPACERRPRA